MNLCLLLLAEKKTKKANKDVEFALRKDLIGRLNLQTKTIYLVECQLKNSVQVLQ